MDLRRIYESINSKNAEIKCFSSPIISEILNKELEISQLNSNPEA